MNFLRILIIGLMIFGLTACAEIMSNVRRHFERQKIEESASIFGSDLDAMGLYGHHVIKLSEAERVYECYKLDDAHDADPDSIDVSLHLAYLMALTPQCGGSHKAMDILNAVQNQIENQALIGSLQYQMQLLQQINKGLESNSAIQVQMRNLKRKYKALKNKLKQKNAELEELEKLRAKLDALKSIEKTFHQRNGSSGK